MDVNFKVEKITPALIQRVAERISAIIHPDKIILFGSYATGVVHRDSDIDLLIIVSDQHRLSRIPRHQRYREVSEAIGDRLFPIDALVRSQSEIRRQIEAEDFFMIDILNEGKVLYDVDQ